jgi:hypothetical protein
MQHPSLFKGISTDDKMRGFNMLFLLASIITGYSVISGSIFDVENLTYFLSLSLIREKCIIFIVILFRQSLNNFVKLFLLLI